MVRNVKFIVFILTGQHGIQYVVKGSLSPSKNKNKRNKDFYCTLHKFVLIRFIQRNQRHRDSVMHEFHSNVNKVNKAVAKVRTIGDRLPLSCNQTLYKEDKNNQSINQSICR